MSLLRYILGYVRKNRKEFMIIIIANFLTYLLALLLPYLNGYFFDMLILAPKEQNIVRFGVMIIILGMISTILTYMFSVYKAEIKSKLTFEMFNDIVCHIQRSDYMQSSKFNPTYLHQRINTDINVLWTFFFEKIINVIFQMVTIVVVFLVIGKLSVPLLILTIALIPVYVLSYMRMRKPLYEKGLKYKNTQSKFYKAMNEQLEFIKIIKLWEHYEVNESKRINNYEKYLKDFMKYNKLSSFYNCLEGSISLIFKVIALVIAGFQILYGDLTLGTYTIVSVYFGMLIQNLKFFFVFGQAYQDAHNSFKRICELLNLQLERCGGIQITEKIENLEINHMNFSYDSRVIFEDLNFQLKKGINLILGANGKGKTTLLHNICGLLLGTENSNVKVNSYNLRDIDINDFRRNKIAIYIQNQRSMDETVEQMLSEYLGSDLSNLSEMIHNNGLEKLYLSSQFHIHSFLKCNICSLSGGEAQRIHLLPVFLKKADLIILDEPTSDLDFDTKKEVVKILQRKTDSIVLIATHEEYLYEKNVNIITL